MFGRSELALGLKKVNFLRNGIAMPAPDSTQTSYVGLDFGKVLGIM